MSFQGERLRSLRLQKGFTQDELADQIDSSQRMIGRYESGDVDPTSDVVIRMSKFFEVTADWLLGLTDDPYGEMTEDDLSPMEKKLLAAFRAGRIVEAMAVIVDQAKDTEK